MAGGLGDDIYFADDAADHVIEAAGEGFDALHASTSYTLPEGASVELLGTADHLGAGPLALTGNGFNNAVTGNAGANLLLGLSGDDSLSGLEGNDILDGGAGADILSGGAGADVFRFTVGWGSPPASPDRIIDFASGTDRIDLTGIDANSGAGGDDALTMIGTAAFSGTAGELRYQIYGGEVRSTATPTATASPLSASS